MAADGIIYAIPTYDRPALIQEATLAYLEWSDVLPEQVDIWVSGESQMPLYKDLPAQWKARLRVGRRGLMENRNYADAQYPAGTRLLWLNDDIFYIRRLMPDAEKVLGRLTKVPITEVASAGFSLCEQHGAHMW